MPERTNDAAAPPKPAPERSEESTTSDLPPPTAAGQESPVAAGQTPPSGSGGTSPPVKMPEYKGEPLDAERGPGLGCFWIQIALLTFFLIFTPLTVTWGWDPFISGALLIFTLVLLLFSGQTIIFLLRLVAADRRTRRTPLDPKAKPTVGQMEEAGQPGEAGEAGTSGEAGRAAEVAGTDDPSTTERDHG